MPKNKILSPIRTRPTSLLTYAGLGSAALLAGLPVLFTLGPVFSSPNVSAETVASESGKGLMTASVGSALAITAQDVSIVATPAVGNTFITKTATINVKNTGSGGGYHLTMSSSNGSLENSGKAIDTFSGAYSKTGSEMKNADTSSWGYTLDPVDGTNSEQAEDKTGDLSATFYPIPIEGNTTWAETADQTEGAYKYAYLKNTTKYTDKTNGDNITVGYGFAIGPNTTAGDYTDTITYTAVANKDTRPETIFRLSTMQDIADYTDACKNTPTPAVTATESLTELGDNFGKTDIDKIPTVTLRDTRDNNTYTIKKLADGNCWMTENLRIAGETLKPADSNVSADYPVPAAISTAGVDALKGDDKAKKAVFTGGANGTYLYTFQVATADKGAALGTDTEGHDKIENSPDDICPKGWHLPNYSGSASWQDLLFTTYGLPNNSSSGALLAGGSNVFGLKLTGNLRTSGSLGNTGCGYYWARTASSADDAYGLSFSSSVNPQYNDKKNNGFGVRCVSEGATE